MAGMKSPLEPCSVIVGLGRYRATVMPKHGPRMLSVISFKFCWMHKGVRDVIASGRLLQARQLRPSVMSFDGEVPLEGWWRGIRYFFGSSGLWNHSNYFSHQSKKANKSVHAIQIYGIFCSDLDLWISVYHHDLLPQKSQCILNVTNKELNVTFKTVLLLC